VLLSIFRPHLLKIASRKHRKMAEQMTTPQKTRHPLLLALIAAAK
jgi:hypothetical protein